MLFLDGNHILAARILPDSAPLSPDIQFDAVLLKEQNNILGQVHETTLIWAKAVSKSQSLSQVYEEKSLCVNQSNNL